MKALTLATYCLLAFTGPADDPASVSLPAQQSVTQTAQLAELTARNQDGVSTIAIQESGIQLTLRDKDNVEMATDDLVAEIFIAKDEHSKKYRIILHPSKDQKKLSATFALKNFVSDAPKLSVRIYRKVSVPSRPIMQFKAEEFTFAKNIIENEVPAGTTEKMKDVYEVVAADEPFIAAQGKCPVADKGLHSMGGPYKVHVEGKAVYICCPGCVFSLKKDPEKYFEILAKEKVVPPKISAD